MALDPRTGAVRAMVGGRDFDDSKFNRATQALRQPGSTFKPIVYADAIQNGRPPSYMVDDSPFEVPQPDSTTWAPQNYDGTFQGVMTMRRGLYLSRNLVAIRVGMELGPESVIDEARRFGITTPIHPYPSIYIGSEGVYPIEMISAYTAFAKLGSRSTPMAITRVENAKGDVLWEPAPTVTPVLSPEEAWEMVDMMKDVVQHGTAYGSVWAAGIPSARGGQDGHDERLQRRVVHRVHGRSRRRRVDGDGPAGEDHARCAGRATRRTGVDGVHDGGLSAEAAHRPIGRAPKD